MSGSADRHVYTPLGTPLPKHGRAWTLEEIRLLRELAEQGMAVVAIARRLGRTANTVRRRAATHGIALPAAD